MPASDLSTYALQPLWLPGKHLQQCVCALHQYPIHAKTDLTEYQKATWLFQLSSYEHSSGGIAPEQYLANQPIHVMAVNLQNQTQNTVKPCHAALPSSPVPSAS